MSERRGPDREGRLLAWLGRVTDASLLGVPRFFGLLYGPIDEGLPLAAAWRAARARRLPAHVGWQHALGGITFFLFLLLVGTGVLLSFYYRPSVQEAYPSIQYLESEISFGWLVRNVHFWAANLVILAVLLHLLRALVTAAYKAPRETNWLLGLFLLVTLLAFGMTGYLLPWDQWAYWTTTHELAVLSRLPLIGAPLVALLQADELVSGATLSRFFAIHVILLPWIALALLSLHFQLVRKHGIALPVSGAAVLAGEPFYPHHMLRQLVVVLLIAGILVTLAALWPRPLSGPADPYSPAADLRALWFPAAIIRATTRYLGGWGLPAMLVLAIALAVLPLVDRSPERRPLKRPVATAGAAVLLAALAALWVAGYRLAGPAETPAPEPPAADVPPQPADALPAAPAETLPAWPRSGAPGPVDRRTP
ncbi:MAG: cytochrome b N-terminal domain-containing protein [Gemmatimonadetes bacterium]|nr:cytochrome b N-terminal domain-containing protein [Gemmatimonadota bacterium]